MRNTNFAIYAVPVALLMMAGTLATPTASADRASKRTTVQGYFTYDRNGPAETIYADLKRTAEKLCVYPGARHTLIRTYDQVCLASVIESGVSRIGRTDLAEVHHSRARG
jgi:hypothetical protein